MKVEVEVDIQHYVEKVDIQNQVESWINSYFKLILLSTLKLKIVDIINFNNFIYHYILR